MTSFVITEHMLMLWSVAFPWWFLRGDVLGGDCLPLLLFMLDKTDANTATGRRQLGKCLNSGKGGTSSVVTMVLPLLVLRLHRIHMDQTPTKSQKKDSFSKCTHERGVEVCRIVGGVQRVSIGRHGR